MRALACVTFCFAFVAAPALADKTDWKAVMKQQANSQLEQKLGLPQAAPAGAKEYLIEPKDGAVVTRPVKVVFGLAGMGVAPAGTQVEGTGHHHVLIDDPAIDYTVALPVTEQIKHFGKGQTETTLDLKPGKHTLQLLLGDWKHQPFNPSVQSEKITVTVK